MPFEAWRDLLDVAEKVDFLHSQLSDKSQEIISRCLDILEQLLLPGDQGEAFRLACATLDVLHGAIGNATLSAQRKISPTALVHLLLAENGNSAEVRVAGIR